MFDVTIQELIRQAEISYGSGVFDFSENISSFSKYYLSEEARGKIDDLSIFLSVKPSDFFDCSECFPSTFKILRSADSFFVRTDEVDLVNVFMVIQGRAIEITRLFRGRNIGDKEFSNKSIRASDCLPKEIQNAFYGKFNGLSVLREPDFQLGAYFLLPMPQGRGAWASLDQLCERHGYEKDKVKRKFESKFPVLSDPDTARGFHMSAFLSTYADTPNDQSSRVHGDYLFVKYHSPDGIIYHIRDGDYKNMRVLTDYCSAIDQYCEHVLLRKSGRFNFLPFTEKFCW